MNESQSNNKIQEGKRIITKSLLNIIESFISFKYGIIF